MAEQEAECREVCQREGWEVVEVFTDDERSASRYAKLPRLAYAQLVNFVQDGKCDVLVTWEASRFQRDLEAYVALRELCRRMDVLWSYSGRTYDLSRTDDRLATGLDALLAERESDVTRERVLRAMRANAVAGKPHGKLPFGYIREYEPNSGNLVRQVIREDQAVLIREAARRITNGEPPYRVVTDWNARGILSPRGAQWGVSVLKRILVNPVYIGKRMHQGKIVADGTWPPILDEASFYKLQAMYGDPDRRKFADPKVKYLLTGIAKCGVCGGRILVRKPRGYPSYTCVEKFCVARKISAVDELIVKLMKARFHESDVLDLLVDEDDESQVLLDQLDSLRSRLSTFWDSAAEGKLSAPALERVEAKLLPEIAALEQQLHRPGIPAAVYALADNPESAWENLSIVEQRQVIRTLLDVTILKAVSGRHGFDPATVSVKWRRSGARLQPVQPTGLEP